MPSGDTELIQRLTQDTCRYLDRLQCLRRLWADVDGHVMASHVAESMGDIALMARHLQTVCYLMMQIEVEYPRFRPGQTRHRPLRKKSVRRRLVI